MEVYSILDPQVEKCDGLEIILCMQSSEMADELINQLLDLDCKIYMPQSVEDAIAKLQFHSFHIAVIDEKFSMDILQVVGLMPMIVRRNMFAIFLGDTVETGNRMQSYVLSTNYVVNKKDLANFVQLLSTSIRENNLFFRSMYLGLQKASLKREN